MDSPLLTMGLYPDKFMLSFEVYFVSHSFILYAERHSLAEFPLKMFRKLILAYS